MELWVGALNLGLLYAFMAIGMFITSRIQNFPDITVDGSFATGAAVSAVLIIAGWHPLAALAAAFLVSAVAGMCTGLIHTALRTNGLLSGIIVMIGLYSINLHIMGRSNIPLLNTPNLIVTMQGWNPGMHPELWLFLCLLLIVLVVWLLVSLFLRTDFGIALQATGDNEAMASASGINVNRMKVFSIAFANALVGLSGGLVAQYQGFADIGMGIGVVVAGLAAVIIGESIIRVNARPFRAVARVLSPIAIRVFSAVVGSIVFRLMIAFALYAGMNPIDLKLLTALFVLATIAASTFRLGRSVAWLRPLMQKRAARGALLTVIAVIALGAIAAWWLTRSTATSGDRPTIGVIQFTDNGLLDMTREGLLEELAALGYHNGDNCTIMLENANGDLPTVNSILDKFMMNKVTLVVTISTPCTQAAVTRITDCPVVFATVANPFIIKAGTSDSVHVPNITGVYGAVDMDSMLAYIRNFIPANAAIGAMWDPAQVNSVYNVTRMQDAARRTGMRFVGATITNSSEVYEAARSVVHRGITAFTLPPDNIVYSAFESVVKAATAGGRPIFTCDVERLGDGALAVYGYDYRSSGRQAAHLVDRILRGEAPASIPFEHYKNLTRGFDERAARACGIAIPEAARSASNCFIDTLGTRHGTDAHAPMGAKKAALVLFNDQMIIALIAGQLRAELERSGVLETNGITLDVRNAQGDFSTAQSIIDDIVRDRYDYLITLSTPVLQVGANGNATIPHVFGYVTDPFRLGVARTATDHRPNITGVMTPQPVETTFRIMREVFPHARTVGLVWNPSEACSEACTERARVAARQHGFTLLEATVSGTGEIMDATRSLVDRGIDLFLTSGDNTVCTAIQTIGEVLRQKRIPYFTNATDDIDRGALIAVGANYAEVGVATARMAIRVFNGAAPADLPIETCVPEGITANLRLAREYGLHLPQHFLSRLMRSID